LEGVFEALNQIICYITKRKPRKHSGFKAWKSPVVAGRMSWWWEKVMCWFLILRGKAVSSVLALCCVLRQWTLRPSRFRTVCVYANNAFY